jgi:serine/threonine protein kinase
LVPASSSEHDPLIGSIVGGRFRITGVLGEGGMGRVYTAEQQMGTSVRKVAVKTLLSEFARDPQVVARFMRECGTVAELEHPNTIKVYDFGQTPTGELYIAMELLNGQALEQAIEHHGAMAPERVDRIMLQVTGSLQEAHEKGIVHRDLKPANIYLTKRGGEEDYVKVLDFGIAKRDEKADKKEQKLTQQGTVLGTPPYMSPEQFRGGAIDLRSDIYALGVMTYEMLTGRLPFEADNPWQWATQHMTAQPYPFEQVANGAALPPKMKAAVMRALEKDPAARQQSAREFHDDLTIGAVGPRLSMLAAASSLPTGYGRPSTGTQVGSAPHMAAQPSGHTLVDSAGVAVHGVPTGGGQSFPTPQPQPVKKGGNGGLIAGAAVFALLGVGAGVYFGVIKPGQDKEKATPSPTVELPTGTATVAPSTTIASNTGGAGPAPSASVTASATATAEPPDAGAEPADAGAHAADAGHEVADAGAVAQADAGPAPTTTTSATAAPTGTGTQKPPAGSPTPAEQQACNTAQSQALGGNVQMAVGNYQKCKGPSRPAAAAAIGAAALRNVQSKKCRAKADAQAAASIGQTAAMNALPKNCR